VTIETLFTAEDLTVRYGSQAAIDGINLSLVRGEILGVVGTNGAGKSTLMGVISGAVQPESGTMRMEGQPYKPASVEEARAAGVGYVPQRITIDPDLSVAEAIFRTSYRSGRPLDEQRRAAADLIGDYGVDMSPDDKISSLVPAELSTIELLRLACEETSLILLDEVSATFNDHEISLFHALALRLAREGRAIMHVSHRIDEVQALSDRILTLRAGKVHRFLTPKETNREEIIEEMFGEKIRLPHRPSDAEAGDEVVRLENVSYGERVKNVTLNVRAGEVLGITGLRRSGMSEVARLIAGVVEPDAGEVHFAAGDDAAERTHQIGFVGEGDEERGLNDTDTISESLMRDVANREMTLIEETRRLREVIASMNRFGVQSTSIHRELGDLSGGDQQKIALARAFGDDKRLFVLNQPTRGIDERSRQDVYALIDEARDAGAAVVLVSSDMTELVSRCHRVAIMNSGTLVDTYANADLTEDSIMMLVLGENWFTEEAPAPSSGGSRREGRRAARQQAQEGHEAASNSPAASPVRGEAAVQADAPAPSQAPAPEVAAVAEPESPEPEAS